MQFKLFTLEQANRLIPDVSRLVAEVNGHRQDVVCLLVELDGLRSHQGQVRSGCDLDRRVELKALEVSVLRRRITSVSASLHDLGCVVRDFEQGLVDFPAVIDGQPAYLCWRAGERRIQYWHGPDEGFAGRRPLHDTQS